MRVAGSKIIHFPSQEDEDEDEEDAFIDKSEAKLAEAEAAKARARDQEAAQRLDRRQEELDVEKIEKFVKERCGRPHPIADSISMLHWSLQLSSALHFSPFLVTAEHPTTLHTTARERRAMSVAAARWRVVKCLDHTSAGSARIARGATKREKWTTLRSTRRPASRASTTRSSGWHVCRAYPRAAQACLQSPLVACGALALGNFTETPLAFSHANR